MNGKRLSPQSAFLLAAVVIALFFGGYSWWRLKLSRVHATVGGISAPENEHGSAGEAPLFTSARTLGDQIQNDDTALPMETPTQPGQAAEQFTPNLKEMAVSQNQQENGETETQWTQPVAEIRGRVLGPEGAPIPGATVVIEARDRVQYVIPTETAAHDETLEAITDQEGYFVMVRSASGVQVLQAYTKPYPKLGLAPGEPTTFSIHEGDMKEGIELRMQYGREIKVKVLGPDDQPLSDILIYYRASRPDVLEEQVTDRNGYVVFAPVGEFNRSMLVGFKGDENFGYARKSITESLDKVVVLKLEPTRRLILEPYDVETGEPITSYLASFDHYSVKYGDWVRSTSNVSANERFAGSEFLEIWGARLAQPSLRGFVDRKFGNFEWHSMHSGKWRVSIVELKYTLSQSGGEPVEWEMLRRGKAEFMLPEIQADGPLRIPVKIEGGRNLSGRVTAVESGDFLNEVKIKMQRQSEPQLGLNSSTSGLNGKKGYYIKENILEGEYLIFAKSNKYISQKPERVIVPEAKREHHYDFSLVQGATIYGHVDGLTQEDLERRVSVHFQVPELLQKRLYIGEFAEIDSDYNFRLENLAPTSGQLVLRLKESDGSTFEIHHPVELVPGEEREINLSASAYIEVSGTVYLNERLAYPDIEFLRFGNEVQSPFAAKRHILLEDSLFTARMIPGINHIVVQGLRGNPPSLDIPKEPAFQAQDIKIETRDLIVTVLSEETNLPDDLEYYLTILSPPGSSINLSRFAHEASVPDFTVPNIIINRYEANLRTNSVEWIGVSNQIFDLAETNEVQFTLRRIETEAPNN